jgi:membrane-associated phospholipid phosphatase
VRHPRQFGLTRNAVYASCAIALVVYTLYPVAPPRLAGLGLLDSVETRSHAYRVLQPPAFVNQYAAMPSMHMGWDLLMALALVRSAGARLVRRAAVLLPPLMLAAIVLTANHYLLDAVAGTVVALIGLAAAQAWERRQDRRRPVAAVAVPRPRTPT